jgi:type IV pilus assembly protein PilM
VDTDSLALINAFNFNLPDTYKDKAVSLLNIGSSYSNLNIIDAKIPRLSRDIGVGGKYLIQKVADAFALDLRAAEELIRNPQKAPETAVKMTEAVALGLGNLVNEIRVSFDYFESQSASSIIKIFLSGSASQSLGLKESLAKMMNIEVEHWDPLERIVFSANLDSRKVKEAAVQLAVAVGLALRG